MAAPSKNFSAPSDNEIDADSPLDETLMTKFRDNDVHLEEAMGRDYTLEVNHNHDGTNSSLISGGAIDTTVQSDGSQVIASGASWTPASGVYQITDSGGSSAHPYLQLFISSVWQGAAGTKVGGILYSDGTNMRLWNGSGGSITVFWQKF